MDEKREPAKDGTEDDIVATAFASYRANVPKEFHAIPATALMARASARSSPRKRALTVSVAALACTGLMFAGVGVAQSVVGPSTPANNPGAEGSGGTNDESDGGDGDSTSGGTGGTSDDSGQADLRTTSIELPDWEGLASQCPAGTYVFSEESDEVPDGEPSEGAGDTDDPGDWELLPNGSQPSYTDLDGDGDNEVVVPVACGDAPGVIALNQSGELMTSMGFVYVSDAPGSTVTIAETAGPNITLNVAESSTQDAQQRVYSYDGGGFTEGPQDDPSDDPSSPTDEPDETPTDGDDSSSDPDPGDDPSPTEPDDDSNRVPTS